MKTGFISKALKLLATGSISLMMAACYGPPARTKAITVVNTDNEPIPNLEITYIDNEGSYEISRARTDESGTADFYYSSAEELANISIRIEDVDGEDNLGYFGTTERPLNTDPLTHVVLEETEE